MPLKPSLPFPIEVQADTLALLACPVCHGALRQGGTGGIACSGCGRVYPVRDGIPVLIAAEGV